MFSLSSILLSLLVILILRRAIYFSRLLYLTRGQPRVINYKTPFKFINRYLPRSRRFDLPEVWGTKFDSYFKNQSTAFFVLNPFTGPAILLVADSGAIKEIATDPISFGKPLELYKIISVWGPNLIASEHSEWRRHRKLIAPTFSESNNKLVWDQCLRICDQWFQSMDENGQEGVYDEPNIVAQTRKLALMVTSSAAFGKDLPWEEGDGVEVTGTHTMTFGAALQGLRTGFVIRILIPKWAYHLPIKRIQESAAYYSEFETYVREMIQERRTAIATGNEIDDVLSILIKGSDQEKAGGRLSEDEILSDIHVILLAGHESTGHTLAAALLLLALYPEHQIPLYAEARTLLQGDEPPYRHFSSLEWSTATIRETLRLFPPVLTIPKRATVDTSLTIHSLSTKCFSTPSPTPVFIPAGTDVRLNACAFHRSPLHWDDADKFEPKRFMETKEKKWDRDAFLPFSVGQRACIGRGFGMVEVTAVLLKIMLHYEVAVPDSLKANYDKKDHETEDQRVKRIYRAIHAITMTPSKIGVCFKKRGTKN